VGPSPRGVAVGAGAVWVALHGASAVARLDPRTGRLKQTIRVGSGPSAIAVGRNEVWVANELDSTVSLINPNSGSVILTRAVAGAPTALAAAGTGVWVAADAPLLTMLGASGQTRTVAIASPATALAPSGTGLLVGVSGIGDNHRGGTLVIRVSYALGHIDPASCCELNWNIRMLSYDGLLAYSKSPSSPDTLVPDLALAIPAPQAAGLSYTFRLRPGLRYWTGAPVRASDIRRGLERAAQSSDVFAAYIGALPGVLACPRRPTCDLRAAVLTNNRAGTITLRLAHPDPDLLLALGLPAFAPAPAGGGIRPGTGPYRIHRYVPGQLIDFERNPYFKEWAPAAQPAGYPDRILLHTDGTASVDVADVLSGRADYTFDYPTPSQLREIELRFPGLLHTEPLPNTDFLPLNTRAAPFNDLRVRQALNFAVDRKAIAALYGGLNDATPTCQIIPATIPGHVPYCPYTRDPSLNGRWTAPDLPRARQLIAASGTRGELVSLVTETPSGPWDEPVGRYIVGVLRQLGYRAHLQVLTPNEWSAAVENYRRPPQIVTDAWVADYPSASQWITLELSCAEWQPPAVVNNHARFCDPTVDRLAAQAAQLQATDPIAADRLWARADRQATNLAPWIPTVTETGADLISSRVGDYQYVPTIGPLLDQLWIR
jgi:peptide/nickel transport system substrate-binding protein